MRRLIVIAVILASLWGGYWYVAASGLRSALPQQVEQLRQAGWQVDYDGFEVAGFPSRLDTRVEALSVASPNGSYGLDAPRFEVLALSYKPNHVIVVAPDMFQIDTPIGPVKVRNDDLRASLRLEATTDLALEQVVVVGEAVELSSDTLGTAKVMSSQLALRPVPARTELYEATLQTNALILPAALQQVLAAPVIDTATANVELRFSAPLDRHAVSAGALSVTELTLTQAQLSIGESSVNLSGALSPAPDGTLTGDVRVNARGWENLLALITAPGFDPQVAAQMLGSVAQEDGSVQLDLSFRNGFAYLGVIPLFPAPRLN